MSDVSVDEAVKQLESLLSEGDDAGVWGETVELTDMDARAIRSVLDELKALQECSTCSCKPGEWCQK